MVQAISLNIFSIFSLCVFLHITTHLKILQLSIIINPNYCKDLCVYAITYSRIKYWYEAAVYGTIVKTNQ